MDMSKAHYLTNGPLPFIVRVNILMLARICGKRPQTVLTIELQHYTCRIVEYTDPTTVSRFWDYETDERAVAALNDWVRSGDADEPSGWLPVKAAQEPVVATDGPIVKPSQ